MPTQKSHQIGPPVPTRSDSPPTMKPPTMMPTATQETVRPWYDGYGPSAEADWPDAATPPCPVGPPGTTEVSCIAASLRDVGLPDGTSPMVPRSEWFDIALLLPPTWPTCLLLWRGGPSCRPPPPGTFRGSCLSRRGSGVLAGRGHPPLGPARAASLPTMAVKKGLLVG